MPQIRGIFFDCDNTLVHTEEAAFEATPILVNAVLEKGGIKDVKYICARITAEFCGKQFKEMIPLLEEKWGFKLTEQDKTDIARLEEEEVTKAVAKKARATLGVAGMLQALINLKTFKVGVVSSSPMSRIKAAMKAAKIDKLFTDDQIFSAKDSNPKSKIGKPDPQIYLYACEQFGLKPWHCIAVEDSFGGGLAALEAGLYLMGYLGCYDTPDKRKQLAYDFYALLEVEVIIADWRGFFVGVRKIQDKPKDGLESDEEWQRLLNA